MKVLGNTPAWTTLILEVHAATVSVSTDMATHIAHKILSTPQLSWLKSQIYVLWEEMYTPVLYLTQEICGQTVSKPLNSFGAAANFDICADSGASAAFFPAKIGAVFCAWQEVPCSEWEGSLDNNSVFYQGGCLPAEPGLWPNNDNGCPDHGSPPS
jgi:hypothetical protein